MTVGETGMTAPPLVPLPANNTIKKGIKKYKDLEELNQQTYVPIRLSSDMAKNYRAELIRGAAQLAAQRNLEKTWGEFILQPHKSKVSLNSTTPKLCGSCHRKKNVPIIMMIKTLQLQT